MRRLFLLICFLISSAPSARAQTSREIAVTCADALTPEIRRMAVSLWAYSETALHETRSSRLLADALETEGFTV